MTEKLLELKNVGKTYDKKKYALKDINLTINKGEFIVVIGPSGAGKSTFIRSINRMIDPSEGEIIFDGAHMEKIKGRELKRQRSDIGMIFQHYNLIGRTNVIKNVLHGRLGKISFAKSLFSLYSESDKQEAVDLLNKVGLSQQIYQRANDLSGGQMQRVGICRAMMQHPKLILADEPIASLDPNSANIVMDYLQDVTKERGITCIVNLHQVDFAKKYATRIIGIQAGKVVFDGKPEELDDQTTAMIYQGKEEQMKLRKTASVMEEGSLAYGEI
ncbi:phosphonate ABC transporter ATP-binding protein [Enterococcus pallens]|uniref:Phosphonate ABC transporter, ATP-binding protein n=1 Tax=Enterococcus pallens ATCC BAA-351 TaxID=1158607 RepID=R2SRD3_9ENTE|nr:phosphonate ABC transporter ATP-binding protein [Enterococcus pallens]EOH97820.1 phosphonate ABC transporter, ATP-binding protein [Enterococcus pallens ATCC BAA-351]EOU20761.1 phosphonate ABC transporter, ATP-binding protein [Enterococcus pallens ATCC BAA-351]OJG79277.1 phosphonate ABC transporter, ATP-binding protein [Enterococcus pallens]